MLNTHHLILDYTHCIDVCPIDSNLLASCGDTSKIMIYDKRCSEIVRILKNINSDGGKLNEYLKLYEVYLICYHLYSS